MFDSSKYKTTLCRSFVKYGKCPVGGACNYAHSDEELAKIEEKKKELTKEEKMEKGRITLRASYPVVEDFLGNILYTNSKLSSPMDLSELEYLTLTTAHDTNNWKGVLLLIEKLFRKLLIDFLATDVDMTTHEYLMSIQNRMDKYIRPSFLYTLYSIGDIAKVGDIKDRYTFEELYMYFRIALERIEHCREIEKKPVEERHVFFQSKDREKTVLCRNINRGGCPLGKKCKYAHTIEEQQQNIHKLQTKGKEEILEAR